jgi:hypothetical protein
VAEEYTLSITEGDNVVEMTEGEYTVTLGIAVPIQGYLGVPDSGSFEDGQVTGWGLETTVAQAIDDLNRQLKIVSETAGGEIRLGTPTDGSFADGYVSTITADTRPTDAVDLLNEGLQVVHNDAIAPRTLGEASPATDLTHGYITSYVSGTRIADAVADLNSGVLEVAQVANEARDDLGELEPIARFPGQQPIGEPLDGWTTGYVTIDPTKPIVDAVDALNVGVRGVSDATSTLISEVGDLGDALDLVGAAAQSPGQQPAKAPTGGWSAGYNPLSNSTLITDALNVTNMGLLAVRDLADTPGAHPAGTPAGGWSAGYTQLGATTPINAGLNVLNTALSEVGATATGAQSAASAATATANAPGIRPLGTPSGGWSVGYSPITDATAINAAVNALNSGLSLVNTTATGAANAAQTPGDKPAGTPSGGWTTGYAAITAATAINAALNQINTGLKSLADAMGAAATVGAPTDGSFADGIVGISPTASLADAIDAINEAALGIVSNAYTFNTLTMSAATTLRWNGRSRIGSSSDGTMQLTNAAGTAATWQAARYQTSLVDDTVHFGNTSGSAGLAIGTDTLSLKVNNQTAITWTTALAATLTGSLTLATAGSAASPTMGFTAGTGLYSPGSGELAWATGGVQRMRITSAGLISLGAADPVTGTVLNMSMPNALSTEYSLSIMSSDNLRWMRWRNDGRLMIQPYCQINNVVVGVWGNSAIGSTSGAMLDFSNVPASVPYTFLSSTGMTADPTFQFNARSGGTQDITRWQLNGTTMTRMTASGALLSQRAMSAKAANYTVLAGETNTLFHNTGATGTITFTLPLAAPGLRYAFVARVAQAITIAPNAADTILGPDLSLAAGASLTCQAAANNYIFLEATAAGSWSVTSSGGYGAWTSGDLTLPAASRLTWLARGGIQSTANGTLQIIDTSATTGALIIGPASAAGVKIQPTSGSGGLSLLTGSGGLLTLTLHTLTGTTITAASGFGSVTAQASRYNRALYASSVMTLTAGLTTLSYSFQSFAQGFSVLGVSIRSATAINVANGLSGINVGDQNTTAPLKAGAAAVSATTYGDNVPISHLNSPTLLPSGPTWYTADMPRMHGNGALTITLTPVGAASFNGGTLYINALIETFTN